MTTRSEEKSSAERPKTYTVPPSTNGEKPDYSFLRIKSVEELSTVEPIQVWDKVICKGDRVMIAGATKSYKSFFAKQFIYCLAYKIRFLDREVPNAILMLDLDMELREYFLRRRIEKMATALNGGRTDRYRCLCLRGMAKKLNVPAVQFLGEQLKDNGFGGLVLDPIYKLERNGIGDNSASEVNTLLDPFDEISFLHDLLFIWLHHHSKGNQALKESHERASGSGGWARYADVVVDLIRHKAPFCFIVQITQRNFSAVEKFVIEFDLAGLIFKTRPDLSAEEVQDPPSQTKTAHRLEAQIAACLAIVRAMDDAGGVSYQEWRDLSLVPESSFKKVKTILTKETKEVYQSPQDDRYYVTSQYKSTYRKQYSVKTS